MGVKIIRCSFETILSKDIITVGTQDLGNGEFAHLKIDEMFETSLSLKLECRVTLEALLNDI